MPQDESLPIDATLINRVQNCRTANQAMRELGEALRRLGWALDRASLRRVDPDEGSVELVGVWSRTETSMSPGTTMPIRSTSFEHVTREAKPVIHEPQPHPPLLDHILEQEGIRSWITIPLWRGAMPVALLSLSSVEPEAFGPDDVPFFEALGVGLSDSLLGLASPLRDLPES